MCAHYACTRSTYLHGVCADHLADTLAAGYRARRFRGQQRLTVAVAGMGAA